jgi:acetyl esterase/lipase
MPTVPTGATPASRSLPARARGSALLRLLYTARLARDLALPGGAVHRYGPGRSQCAELHLPAGAGPHPVVVLLHGGAWQHRYGKLVMRALARDLRRRGCAVWNIEYRRVGGGGGWPATFEDVGAAIEHLRVLDAPLDLEHVGVVGHSSGGHLALWAASRDRLRADAPGRPATGEAPLALRAAVALAGVCDLAGAHRAWRGGPVEQLMGGSPEQLPDRYAAADPMALLPPSARVLLVHGLADQAVGIKFSRRYEAAARAAGADVELIEVEGRAGDHRAHIDPRSGAWHRVVEWLVPSIERYSQNERASSTSSRTP